VTEFIEFEAPLEWHENNVYGYHVKVPAQVAEHFSKYSDKRVIAVFNARIEKAQAMMPHPSGFFLILNKADRKQLGLELGSTVIIRLTKDTSKYGMPMPEEMEACLDQDHLGLAHFEALTPGKRRTLIHLVAKMKNSEKRISKSLAILQHLNESEGQLDFKMLNETIKEFNSRFKLH